MIDLEEEAFLLRQEKLQAEVRQRLKEQTDALDELRERGWKLTLHDISLEKSGNVFQGTPDDVLAKAERYEEHGDQVRAHAEVATQRRQHQEIDRLVTLIVKRFGEYDMYYSRYLKGCTDPEHGRNVHSWLQQLDQATEWLGKALAAWEELLGYPKDVLLKNKRFQAFRDALPEVA